jgi:anti-sigma regulatory factor (Ser/Thr protein kinase)
VNASETLEVETVHGPDSIGYLQARHPTMPRTRPDTVARARETARDFLCALSPKPAPETIDTVILVVSELVTNAMRHAGGVRTLRLAALSGAVEVAVEDPSPVPPRERTPDLSGRAGGFGWPLVRHLASVVNVSQEPGGKIVSAVVPC